MTPSRPPKRSFLMGHCALLLLGVALAVELWPTEGLQAYQERARPELLLGRDEITKRNAAFLRLGWLEMSSKFCTAEELAADSAEARALYGQSCPPPDEKRLEQGLPPSTALLPPVTSAIPEGVMVVSLVCRSSDLFHPDHGIVMHPLERGRESERPAWLTARLGSEVVLESPVGLRIHGGHSRSLPAKSFSVVFREEYGGRDESSPGLFFGADTPALRHVVLMNAAHPSRFNSALATEIAALAGCKTSRCTPAVVYLNGTEIKSPFFLYEHQSPDFIQGRYGLEDIEWVRLKSQEPVESEAYIEWRRWIRRDRSPILMSEEAARYDLQDLNAWVLAMTFTATGDSNQGAYFRDRKNPSAVWQSLTWDLDWAFDVTTHSTRTGPVNHADRPFEGILGDRARLFHRLFDHSAEYRDSFQKYTQERLSTAMTQDALMSLMNRYENLARSHPSSSIRLMEVMQSTRSFLEQRREHYLKHLHDRLKAVECEGGLPVAEK